MSKRLSKRLSKLKAKYQIAEKKGNKHKSGTHSSEILTLHLSLKGMARGHGTKKVLKIGCQPP